MESVTPSTAGASVQDLRRAWAQLVGEEVVAAAVASLPDGAREQVEHVTPVSWVPMETLAALIDAVGAAAGRDPDALLDEAVRLATRRTFRTLWRVMLRLTSAHALMARTSMMYRKARNVGELTSEIVADRHARLTLRDHPAVTERQARTLGISIEEVLRLTGRRDVRVERALRPDGAVYDVTWR